MFNTKFIVFGLIALFAGLGALIGYSQVLCPDGSCAMTGSWPGGAAIGGVLGYVVASAMAG